MAYQFISNLDGIHAICQYEYIQFNVIHVVCEGSVKLCATLFKLKFDSLPVCITHRYSDAKEKPLLSISFKNFHYSIKMKVRAKNKKEPKYAFQNVNDG